jgi:hypothetical protein
MGDQLTIGIGHAAAYFVDLRVGQSYIAHVFDVVEQRPGGGILLSLAQSFDLAQRLFEQLCHNGNIARQVRSSTPASSPSLFAQASSSRGSYGGKAYGAFPRPWKPSKRETAACSRIDCGLSNRKSCGFAGRTDFRHDPAKPDAQVL